MNGGIDPADAEFAAAIHLANQPNYLGNPAVIAQILKDLSMTVLKRWNPPVEDIDANLAADARDCERTALIFLGQDSTYAAMPGWNRPSIIDEFVARSMGNPDPEPLTRVASALLEYLTGMWELVGPWRKGELSDSEFQKQLLALAYRYRNLLMGVVEPTR